MRLTKGLPGRRARIEVVALMDVMFLLLVFFIYAILSMTSVESLGLRLPEARGDANPAAASVVVDRFNSILIGGRPATAAEAAAEVAGRAGRDGKRATVLADRDADVGIVMELLAALREAGVIEVGVAVEGE